MVRRELPHVTVATVVERDGRFLIVEEQIEGRSVYNQPAGHWETGEGLIDAAIRETIEETGWQVRIDHLIGIYSYHPLGLPHAFLRLAFAATPLACHGPQRDPAIRAVHWMDEAALRAAADRLRSPMVLATIEDYRAGRRVPAECLRELAPGA